LYATKKNSVQVPTHEWVPDPAWVNDTTGGMDSGVGYEANVDAAVDLLAGVLGSLSEMKAQVRAQAPDFQARWSTERTLRDSWSSVVKLLRERGS
jgi:hypothetical protein